MLRKLFLLYLILLTIASYTNQTYAQQAKSDTIQVFTAIDPIAYIAREVSGSCAQVNVLMQSNQNPHTFEPTPRQMTQLATAQLYFKIGIAFEEEVLKKFQSNFANLRIVDCSEGIIKRHIEDHSHHHHEENTHHDDDHETDQEHLDPHIWLSPPNAILIAEKIRQAFTQADPDNAKIYQANYDDLSKRITEVHTRLTNLLKPFEGQRLYVFHPAFGYFTDTYGIEQVAIETGGKSPTPKQLAHIIQQTKIDHVKIIFVQPQFEKRNAQAIASAINGSVVILNPMETNLLENFIRIADSIEEAFKQ